MEPGPVSSYIPDTERVVTHDGMLSVSIIRIWFKKLWGIGRGGKRTTRVYIRNRNVTRKRIRVIPRPFVWVGTIINGNGKDIQIWATTIN